MSIPNTQHLQGFQTIMQKHEELKQAFTILKQAVDKAEVEFNHKYQQIINGITSLQANDANNLAKICNSFSDLSKNLDSFKQQ